MKKVTNRDIAREAGVSPAAVCLAFSGKKGISEETRSKILRIAQEMDYAPPARSRPARLGNIVILLEDYTEPLLPSFLSALIHASKDVGFELRILTSSQIKQSPRALLNDCELLVTFDDLERVALDSLAEVVGQILVIDGSFSRKPYWNLRIDYAGAAYELTRHLSEQGHRSFIYLNDSLSSAKNMLCFSGFQKLILEQNLPLRSGQIIMDSRLDPNIWSHFPDIIRSYDISAIVCTSDSAATQAVDQLRSFGFRVPQDISVANLCCGEVPVHPGFSFTNTSLDVSAIENEIHRLCAKRNSPDEIFDILIPFRPITKGNSVAPPKFNPADKKLGIALYLKDHPTLRVARAGFLNKVQQLGYQAEVVSIESNDQEEYDAALRSLLDLKVDGVASWLISPEVFRVFSHQGIPIVVLHSPTRDSEDHGEQARIGVNAEHIAEDVAEFFAKNLKGRVGILAVNQSGENPLEDSITKNLTKIMSVKCPNITVRYDFDFVGDISEHTDRVIDYIRQTPDVIAAFSTAGFACVTWAAAKKAAGRKDILIVGTDYSDESIHLVETGEVSAFVAQPIYEEGQMSVAALDAILRGTPFPYFCSLDAPLITADNLDKYKRLLQDVKNWYV